MSTKISALCVCLAALAAAPGTAQALGPDGGLDNRAWEIVSPLEKNGGEVGRPGTPEGGVMKAAAAGGAVAYGSDASFGDAQGAPPVSQYLATRAADGWRSTNLSPPLLSGTYSGDPYLLFSDDLQRGILENGWRCRDGSPPCSAENPPLGPSAPGGYRNLYLHDATGYTPLITSANSPLLTVAAEDFELSLGAASPDLGHIVIATCAALVAGAVEVPGPDGCDPNAQNLYLWQAGQLEVINKLPGQPVSSPGAAISSSPGAVSSDGSRVYWSRDGNIYLWERGITKLVSEGGAFERAARDGSSAFYLMGGHLYRYAPSTEFITDLTPAGGVVALVGSSDNGSKLFFVAATGLFRIDGGALTKILTASPGALPPASGYSRASADGDRLFFNYPGVLHPRDTNQRPDVYEWEGQGRGTCTGVGGCIGLISAGNGLGASLADASATGDDVFFTTAGSLLPGDAGGVDLFDARVGGGFPEPPPPFECEGDDCQGPPTVPADPTPGTAVLVGHSNPPLRIAHRHRKKKHRRHGKAKKRRHHKHISRGRGGHR